MLYFILSIVCKCDEVIISAVTARCHHLELASVRIGDAEVAVSEADGEDENYVGVKVFWVCKLFNRSAKAQVLWHLMCLTLQTYGAERFRSQL